MRDVTPGHRSACALLYRICNCVISTLLQRWIDEGSSPSKVDDFVQDTDTLNERLQGLRHPVDVGFETGDIGDFFTNCNVSEALAAISWCVYKGEQYGNSYACIEKTEADPRKHRKGMRGYYRCVRDKGRRVDHDSVPAGSRTGPIIIFH